MENKVSFRALDKRDPKDMAIIQSKFAGGPKKTRITFMDANTKEVLGEYENKIVITGSMLTGVKVFGFENYPVELPTYNSEMNLEHTVDPGTEPTNPPIICLFCIDDSGCGTTETDVYPVKYIDRIKPSSIIPFQYLDPNKDLDHTLGRSKYFGRKVMDDGKIAYYFKAFESQPQMFMEYTDGTEITPSMYDIETDQDADCFVDMELMISSTDCRDYFDKVIGWENARVSSLSLCYAWYVLDEDEPDKIKWYQDIMPYSKLNFSVERLVDSTKSILIKYDIFF